MVRAKKSGAASRGRESDGDFKPKQRTPTKKSPRKLQDPQQQEDPIDEGIAASPNSSYLQARVEKDDSTSPQQQQTVLNTPLQTPVRGKAARSLRSKNAVANQISGKFEKDSANGASGAAGPVTQSKIIVLKVTPHKLLEVFTAYAPPQKKVTLKLPPDQLRTFRQKVAQGDPVTALSALPKDPAREGGENMAPVKHKNPHDVLDAHIMDVIQDLYEIASITHGYLPQSRRPLVNKSIELTHSLAALSDLTADDSTHPAAATVRSILIPPEVIDYLANGRNPDIYTREFVENVQRGNYVLNGKMRAFGQFAEINARETKSAVPELAAGMDRVMEHSGNFEREAGTGEWKMKPQTNGP